MAELKPCPFCGSENVVLRWFSDGVINDLGIGCNECGAKFQLHLAKRGAIEDNLIEAWNKRAYTTDELFLNNREVPGIPLDDLRVFGMSLDEIRQMIKRDKEREFKRRES